MATSNSGSGAVLAGSQSRRKYLKALTSMSGNGTSAKSRMKGSLDVEDDDEIGRSLLLGLVLIADVEACCWCWSSRAW
jgi:hypothetical protein